jgi:hypothetical protein
MCLFLLSVVQELSGRGAGNVAVGCLVAASADVLFWQHKKRALHW